MWDRLLIFLKLKSEPPNYRDSGEPISKKKLLLVVETLTEMGLIQISSEDPVVLALIEKTRRKIHRIAEMSRKGEITLQQSLDEKFEVLNESQAFMTILSGDDNR